MNTRPESRGLRADIELSSLDLRYEGCRLKQAAVEARLLASIAARGIEEPLEGVAVEQAGATPVVREILLNGFKRYRCARKLRLQTVPYVSLGQDEVAGILNLLRTGRRPGLSILEQARFLDELQNLRSWSLGEMAAELSVSKAWVSMRLGLIGEMSAKVREKLFSGAFPAYAYMCRLRPFMRMNGVQPQQIEPLVVALSGKGLSVREVELLAHGFFRGPESFRREILRGNVALSLKHLEQVPPDAEGCNAFEGVLLHDLEILQKYMQRVMGKSQDGRLQTRAFHAQAHLLTTGILSRATALIQTLRGLHDRSGQA